MPEAEFSAHPLALEKGLAGEEGPHQRMLNRLAHEVAYRWALLRVKCGCANARGGAQVGIQVVGWAVGG